MSTSASRKNIAKITPLVRLPSATDVFDYSLPADLAKKIRPGSLVKIPWRNHEELGVVLAVTQQTEKPSFKMKSILSLEKEQLFTAGQLFLLKKFAAHYAVTEGAAARLMAPDIPKKAGRSKTTKSAPMLNFSLARQQLKALKLCADKFDPKQHYLLLSDISSFVWFIRYWIHKHPNQTIAVIAPSVRLVRAFSDALAASAIKNAAILSGQGKNERWAIYQDILSGRTKAVVSTRQGVFLPFQENTDWLIFEPKSEDLKQRDQHPRYSAPTVLSWLADQGLGRISLASSSPILGEARAPLALPSARVGSQTLSLIDMKKEMEKKDFSPIPDIVLDTIQKPGAKSWIISLREKSPEGLSVEKISHLLTDKLKNCRIKRCLEPISPSDFDILVSTPQALENADLALWRGKIENLILSSVEPLLSLPDYRSAERTYARLKHWQMLAAELGIKNIYLLAYSPAAPAIRAFAYGETEKFFCQETENRKKLGYPPFVSLVRLSLKTKDQKEAERIKKELKFELPPSVKVQGPYLDMDERPSLLLKLSEEKVDLAPLKNISLDWIMDRDPENVL